MQKRGPTQEHSNHFNSRCNVQLTLTKLIFKTITGSLQAKLGLVYLIVLAFSFTMFRDRAHMETTGALAQNRCKRQHPFQFHLAEPLWCGCKQLSEGHGLSPVCTDSMLPRSASAKLCTIGQSPEFQYVRRMAQSAIDLGIVILRKAQHGTNSEVGKMT